MYRSVRISKHSYDIIEEMAKRDKRTIVATIDLLVENAVKEQLTNS